MTYAPQAAAFWTALLLILMIVLAALVIRQRKGLRVGIGDGGHDSLQRASRVFGNAAEYIPAGIATLALLVGIKSPLHLIHIVGGLLFVGRLLHAFGLGRNSGVSFGRLAGMILTLTAYGVAAVALLIYAFA